MGSIRAHKNTFFPSRGWKHIDPGFRAAGNMSKYILCCVPGGWKFAKRYDFQVLAMFPRRFQETFTTHLGAYKTPSYAREVPPCFRIRGSHRQCETACLRYSCRPICSATCFYRSLCSHGIPRRPQDTTTRFRDAPRCIQSPRGSSRLGRTSRNHHLLPRLRHLSPFLHHCFPRLLYT